MTEKKNLLDQHKEIELKKAAISCDNLSWAEPKTGPTNKRLEVRHIKPSFCLFEFQKKIHFDQDKGNEVEVIFKEIKALLFISIPKGQLISKCLFGVLNSSKKRMKTIWPEVEFCCSFFGRLWIPKSIFEANWPLVSRISNFGNFGPILGKNTAD